MARKAHLIAMLATGDWTEITDDAPVYVYEMDDEEFQEFVETGGEDTTLGMCVRVYGNANLEARLARERAAAEARERVLAEGEAEA